jgi:hypothetical protein
VKKPTTKDRLNALRAYWLVLSVGWEEAARILAARERGESL